MARLPQRVGGLTVWFAVDDGLAFHRKTLAAGNAAMGLWVRAGSWLRRPENARSSHPGVLLYAEARTMGTAAEVNRLVAAGLWHKTTLDGAKALRFHDWHVFQPSVEDIEEKRTDWAGRKRRQRAHRRGDHTLCLPDYCDDAPPPPDDEWGVS